MARPSKLTPDVREIIVQAIRDGNTRPIAAKAAGIAESTLYLWLQRGKYAANHKDRRWDSKLYLEFMEAIESAEADAVRTAVAAIRRAGLNGSWSASAWWLERMYPEDWVRKDHIKLEIDREALAIIADVINRVVTDPKTLNRLRVEFAHLGEQYNE